MDSNKVQYSSRIMCFGTTGWGGTCLQRFKALETLFETSYLVDSRRVFPDKKIGRSFLKSIQGRLGWGPLIKLSHLVLLSEANRFKPDVLWIDNGFFVSKETIQEIRSKFSCLIIHYTPDSLSAPGMNNGCIRHAIPAYDVTVTTKEQDIERYNKLGARWILYSLQGYDPTIHHPVSLNRDEMKLFGSEVIFVGQCMKKRLESLRHLYIRLRPDLRIYGAGWNSRSVPPDLKPTLRKAVYGEMYSKVLSGSKIALGFLNNEVGDSMTSRSFEIPACGRFLLAERTKAHQHLFREDSEAVFFSTDSELVDKVQYYLKNDADRERIAMAGYKRVTRSEFTWRGQINHIVDKILG